MILDKDILRDRFRGLVEEGIGQDINASEEIKSMLADIMIATYLEGFKDAMRTTDRITKTFIEDVKGLFMNIKGEGETDGKE